MDSDKRADKFFSTGSALRVVEARRSYGDPSRIDFYHMDYTKDLPIPDESVNLLISQYAGFVSEHCMRYLARGGILIANNSHGDAGVAHCNTYFELVGVVQRRGERFTLSADHLDRYFTPKGTGIPDDPHERRHFLLDRSRGISYTHRAFSYVFRRK